LELPFAAPVTKEKGRRLISSTAVKLTLGVDLTKTRQQVRAKTFWNFAPIKQVQLRKLNGHRWGAVRDRNSESGGLEGRAG
jgi:hypothetical protein